MTLLLKKQNITLTALLQFTIESVLSSDNKERTNKINRNDMHTVEHLQNLLHISLNLGEAIKLRAFFKLADLNDLMTRRLTQLGSSISKLNATLFKEELLGRLPGIQFF